MIITPDLKQNILYTVYFTITHNAPAFLYSAGIVVAVIISFIRPSRKALLLSIGFIVLLFTYEYNKHIVENLREQTINALITIQEHNKVRRIINLFTLRLIPFVLPIIGWGMVCVSIFLYWKQKTKNATIKK